MSTIPNIDATYHKGTHLKLYPPEMPPVRPAMNNAGTVFCAWPILKFNAKDKTRMAEVPLAMCYEHDIPQSNSSPIDVELLAPLSTGAREDSAAQVWRARFNRHDKSGHVLARIYDPLYWTTVIYDRFRLNERSVATVAEIYSRLEHLQGNSIPRFHGVFVAKIPVPGGPPRCVYVVLMEYIDGTDIAQVMEDGVGMATCIEHKATIVNATARILLPIVSNGIYLKDLREQNTIIQIPPVTPTFYYMHYIPFSYVIWNTDRSSETLGPPVQGNKTPSAQGDSERAEPNEDSALSAVPAG
ncbi:hypothetical protein C8R46DRAFT_1273132 [Mycena filopes]|nr:hypothetical protein C8R46DRAFT_1273132 [Mycena filopes]